MKHTLKIFLVLVAVVAWGIDGSTPRVEGVAFSVDRHTAGTVGAEDAKKGLPFPGENFTGRSAGDFLTPDGRFDLKAIRESGYQGPLDLKGLDVGIEPRTGEPILSRYANAKIFSHPDDTFWTDKFSCAAGLGNTCFALCVYDGKLIAGGYFQVAKLHAGDIYSLLGRFLLVPLGVGDE
jgi:hypothetical protein